MEHFPRMHCYVYDCDCLQMKKFTFGQNINATTCHTELVDIHIPEVLDVNYGMYVWPCAVVLAQYIWSRRDVIAHSRVIELGAGTALPGVLAAKLGAEVVLSDAIHLPHCLENSRASCHANNVTNVHTVPLSWGHFSASLLSLGELDIILGSDCFYSSKDFEDILVTVKYLLSKNPYAEFWTTYQLRGARSIAPLLHKWGMTCRNIPLASFDADGDKLAGSDLPGSHSIEMLVITMNTQEADGLS